MIQARYHYNRQHDMEMKCADVFLTKKAFEEWHSRYKEEIKNLTTIPRIEGL